jgi:hypothetical protein
MGQEERRFGTLSGGESSFAAWPAKGVRPVPRQSAVPGRRRLDKPRMDA